MALPDKSGIFSESLQTVVLLQVPARAHTSTNDTSTYEYLTAGLQATSEAFTGYGGWSKSKCVISGSDALYFFHLCTNILYK